MARTIAMTAPPRARAAEYFPARSGSALASSGSGRCGGMPRRMTPSRGSAAVPFGAWRRGLRRLRLGGTVGAVDRRAVALLRWRAVHAAFDVPGAGAGVFLRRERLRDRQLAAAALRDRPLDLPPRRSLRRPHQPHDHADEREQQP